MYLILYPGNMVSQALLDRFEAVFTTDLNRVHASLRGDNNVRVFKLDSLIEIKEITVTYEEITKEMQ